MAFRSGTEVLLRLKLEWVRWPSFSSAEVSGKPEKKDIWCVYETAGHIATTKISEQKMRCLYLTLSAAFPVAKQSRLLLLPRQPGSLPICLLMLCICTGRRVVPCLRPSPREGLVSSRIPRPAAALLLRMEVLLVRRFPLPSVPAAQLMSRPPSRRPCIPRDLELLISCATCQ